jgi:alkylation response protein AidB-like acyl-CoA dehydrogenase
MDFRFTPEQIELRQKAREFAEKEIEPIAHELDSNDDLMEEGLNRLKKSGFYAYVVPKEYGGKGVSSINLCILREEFAKVSSFLDEAFVMQGLGSYPIVVNGTEEQKKKYLTPLVDGSRTANFCLTERSSGSDVAGIQATALLEGNEYVLNGIKSYVSRPRDTDISTVFAKTDPNAGGKGISAFIVDREISTYRGENRNLIGQGRIGEIFMEDMKVPQENLLGKEGEGMRIGLGNLSVFRPTVGAATLGMAHCALALALEYAGQRDMFRQKLGDFQVTQFKLAEMKIQLDAAALLIFRAAWLADNPTEERTTLEASAAKFYATEVAQKIVDQSLQIHGGIGLHESSRIAHLYQSVRAPRIYEGASEIQLLVIGRELMRRESLTSDTRL